MPEAETITVVVTRSAGADGAVVVLLDTTFEPGYAPGLRVLLNDALIFEGAPYKDVEGDLPRDWRDQRLIVDLDSLAP